MDNNLELIQSYSLELLKQLDKVFEENGLRYYIIGGTLLGAIRHKGFIPWDDDIDVAVPRKDYEYLLEHSDELFEEPFKLLHYSNCSDNRVRKDIIIRLVNSNVVVDFEQNNNIQRSNIALDVIPLDGTPDNALIRKIYFFRLLMHRALYKFTFHSDLDVENDTKRSGLERFLIKFAKVTKIGNLIDPSKELKKLKKLLSKYDYQKSQKMAGTFLGAYKLREFTDSKYFRERKKYKFEDGEFYGTDDYDGYLKSIYGDYMQLPPEEKRVGKHKILKVEEIK